MNSRIFFAAVMELVITIMLWMLFISMAGMRPVQMAMSSALTAMMLMGIKRFDHETKVKAKSER